MNPHAFLECTNFVTVKLLPQPSPSSWSDRGIDLPNPIRSGETKGLGRATGGAAILSRILPVMGTLWTCLRAEMGVSRWVGRIGTLYDLDVMMCVGSLS